MRRLAPMATLAAVLLAGPGAHAQQRSLPVPPQATDARLGAGEPPHWVIYDPAVDEPLVVWLPGTHGKPGDGSRPLLQAMREAGYRVIGLSYLNDQAVGQVCVGQRLRRQPRCAALMRQQRVWGDAPGAPIDDRPEDAIVPRLTALLRHLARQDPEGGWAGYLDGNEPRWGRIVLAGQSQGGGMAAFLAQTRVVAGVLSFSGGWDRAPDGGLAGWYRRPSVTPPERWQATYHAQEGAAALLAQSYQALRIPPAQVHALDLPVRPGHEAHGEGIGNPAYAPLWREMLAALKPTP
ncbi:MAG: hypothetical protein JNL93_21550 [Pelomonas sp.]|nr:hypothetical protein [Roseateles sp.]